MEDNSDSNTQNKKSRKIPKIFDGKYFEIDGNVDESGNVSAKCMTCNQPKSGSISSTGNFFKHYKKRHPLKLEEMKMYTKTKEDGTKTKLQQKLDKMLPASGPTIDQNEVCSNILNQN